jgi:hypothetical protein
MDLCRAFYAGVPEAIPEEEQEDDGCVLFPKLELEYPLT